MPVRASRMPCSISAYVTRAAIDGVCVAVSQNIAPWRIIGGAGGRGVRQCRLICKGFSRRKPAVPTVFPTSGQFDAPPCVAFAQRSA